MIATVSSTARVRKARYDDIKIIAANMRESDKQEVWDSDNLTPQEALERSYKESVICFTIVFQGNAIGMFGVVPFALVGTHGSVWMLATNDLCHVNRRLIRRSKEFIDVMLKFYPHLENWVSCKNVLTIKWLKFMGADFGKPMVYGKEKQMFQKFVFVR